MCVPIIRQRGFGSAAFAAVATVADAVEPLAAGAWTFGGTAGVPAFSAIVKRYLLFPEL